MIISTWNNTIQHKYEASFYGRGRALIMERRIGRMEPNFDGRLPQLKEHCQREHNKENESTELNLITCKVILWDI